MAAQDSQIQPYLFFNGRCDEALEFYRRALDAQEVQVMRYNEAPQGGQPLSPGWEKKVMHSSFRVGASTILASDGHCEDKLAFDGFALTIVVPDEAAAERYFNGLAQGGAVRMPLTKTFFSPKFGMVADQFGVLWMIYVGQ